MPVTVKIKTAHIYEPQCHNVARAGQIIIKNILVQYLPRPHSKRA